MEIRQLRTFRTVATLLSFNKAADQLHYAQSTISAQIQSLEDELGVRLFDRLGRRILLTEAGERLLQYAEKILDLTEQSRMDVAGAIPPTGFSIWSLSVDILFLPFLSFFKDIHDFFILPLFNEK